MRFRPCFWSMAGGRRNREPRRRQASWKKQAGRGVHSISDSLGTQNYGLMRVAGPREAQGAAHG